jgi:pimeloyl-ACP methyl ester carboxylesterase
VSGRSTARWRVLARNALFLVLALGAISALIEHILERRDAARLTAGESFFTAHGRRIRYHLTGTGAPGPTLVLLNGSSASLEQWSEVQAALSPLAPVLSYDRGGTGFSDAAGAHDANAGAEELDELLRSPGIKAPFVLVSFSSSAPLATVFAAKHLDVIKGIVFVDPILSSPPGTKSWRRIMWRPTLANPLKAFFGYTRLKHAIAEKGATPASPESERWNAVILSTHHWLAGGLESMNLDASGEEADTAIASHPFSDLPLAVLTTADPAAGQFFSDIFDRQKALAVTSKRDILRVMHGVHSEILHDPAGVGSVVDVIRTILEEVRAGAAAGVDGPSR